VIRVYDAAGNLIVTHEHAGKFKEWWCLPARHKRNRELVEVAPLQLSEEVPGRSGPFLVAEFLKARIIPERIEHRIEPEKGRSERAPRERAGVRDRE
jgi:hypothetical protein